MAFQQQPGMRVGYGADLGDQLLQLTPDPEPMLAAPGEGPSANVLYTPYVRVEDLAGLIATVAYLTERVDQLTGRVWDLEHPPDPWWRRWWLMTTQKLRGVRWPW